MSINVQYSPSHFKIWYNIRGQDSTDTGKLGVDAVKQLYKHLSLGFSCRNNDIRQQQSRLHMDKYMNYLIYMNYCFSLHNDYD